MHSDAAVARAEDRVHPVEAADCSAPATRFAFVAWGCDVVEVSATRALKQIAADRRHVAQLLRGAGQQCTGQHGIALPHQRVIGEIRVAHQRADAEPAIGSVLNLVEGKPGDIDQLRWPLDVHLHKIDQIRAPGDELCAWAVGHEAHRLGGAVGARILEVDHGCPIACWIAATMLGYAPQRQMFPLINSRISSAVLALPSAIKPAAEQIWPGVQ
jgi:hypothetical protein